MGDSLVTVLRAESGQIEAEVELAQPPTGICAFERLLLSLACVKEIVVGYFSSCEQCDPPNNRFILVYKKNHDLAFVLILL